MAATAGPVRSGSPFGGTVKLPSLDQLAASAASVLRRFPEVVACAAVAGLAAVEAVGQETIGFAARLAFTSTLGLPLFITLTLVSERRGWAPRLRWAVSALGMALLVFLYYRLRPWDDEALGQRWMHLVLTFHMAATVVPYLGFKASHGFWQYNRVLFFRFLLATLYSGVLFAGLSLALAAIDNLLGISVPDLHYPRLFFLIAFFFHPIHFLAGVPADFEELERSRYYPGALRVLSQFVMLPLVAVYVTILLLYLGRIVVTGTWPSGWTGYLVSSLAVAGIFSLLVAYPERIAGGRAWLDRYALAFWVAILPASVMVLLALWQRIEQYGVTERRYLLGVLAVWLGATALHRVITRTRDIKGIPLTLTIIGAATFVGPWSAYAAAERSQAGRVEEILAAHGGLVEGRVAAEPVEIPFDEWEQVEEAVGYLIDNHGTGVVERWVGGDALMLAGAEGVQLDRDERVERVMEALRVLPELRDRAVDVEARGRGEPLPVEGFDLVVVAGRAGPVRVGDRDLSIRLSEDGGELEVRWGDEEQGRASLAALIAFVDERSRFLEWSEDLEVPRASMTFEAPGESLSVRLVLRSMRLARRDGRLAATGFDLEAVLLRWEAAVR